MINAHDESQLAQAVQSASANLAEYVGSDVSQAALAMLDILAASYVPELMHCEPERLKHYQAALKQTLAIKAVFEGRQYADPRI